jgi:hypothetical protein
MAMVGIRIACIKTKILAKIRVILMVGIVLDGFSSCNRIIGHPEKSQQQIRGGYN